MSNSSCHWPSPTATSSPGTALAVGVLSPLKGRETEAVEQNHAGKATAWGTGLVRSSNPHLAQLLPLVVPVGTGAQGSGCAGLAASGSPSQHPTGPLGWLWGGCRVACALRNSPVNRQAGPSCAFPAPGCPQGAGRWPPAPQASGAFWQIWAHEGALPQSCWAGQGSAGLQGRLLRRHLRMGGGGCKPQTASIPPPAETGAPWSPVRGGSRRPGGLYHHSISLCPMSLWLPPHAQSAMGTESPSPPCHSISHRLDNRDAQRDLLSEGVRGLQLSRPGLGVLQGSCRGCSPNSHPRSQASHGPRDPWGWAHSSQCAEWKAAPQSKSLETGEGSRKG